MDELSVAYGGVCLGVSTLRRFMLGNFTVHRRQVHGGLSENPPKQLHGGGNL